jgi:transposase
MLGRKVFAPKLFYRFSLEAQVPEDHLLRRVAAAVDFAFVRRLTGRFYSRTGRPGLDPVVLFKLSLLGYLYGITSERRLAEEVRLHLAYRWFLGYDLDEATPDHSVLSKARARFGLPIYQAFFAQIVRQCARAGLVHGDVVYVDSTLVEANASLQSSGARALLAQLPSAAGYVEAVWQENPAPAPSGAGKPRRRAAGPPASGAAPAERAAGPALHVAGPADAPNGRQGTVNDLVVSRTDPEAGLVKRVGVPSGFYYKVHVGVDGGRARLITALEVTAGEVADEHLLERLLKEHAGTTGRTVAEAVADTKYGTHANYAALEARGIRASIPSVSAVRVRGAYGADRFVYEAAADRYRCPTGQFLTRYGASSTAAPGGGVIYRARAAVCRVCPVRAWCCAGAAARSVIRPNDQALRDRVAAYLRTRGAKRRLRRRAPWIETANAELKERHGLRRARGRGRDRMLIQALGAAMAYDVKKLAQLGCHGPAEGRAILRLAAGLTAWRRRSAPCACTWRQPGLRGRHPGTPEPAAPDAPPPASWTSATGPTATHRCTGAARPDQAAAPRGADRDAAPGRAVRRVAVEGITISAQSGNLRQW